MSEPRNRIVFRSTFGIVLTLVTWTICVLGMGSAIVSDMGATPLLVLAALGWFVWLAYWRPCVVTDDEGVELRNLVRDVTIPYAAIEDVDTRYALRITADGRTWSAWGAPAPSGAGALRDGMRRGGGDPSRWRDAPQSLRETGRARVGDATDTASGAPATVIRRELERRARAGLGAEPAARVTVRVRPLLVAVSACLVLAAGAAVALGG